MKREVLACYKKKVVKDLVLVDKAIDNDVYLSKEEWFDFLFKSALVGYRSINIVKYSIFNNNVRRFAEVCAEAFNYMSRIAVEGFNNETYIYYVVRIVSRLNRFIRDKSKKLYVDGYDKDGSLIIEIAQGYDRPTPFKVRGVSDASERLNFIIGCGIDSIDIFSHKGDFGKFLIGYINGEYKRLIANKMPEPYTCGNKRHSLKEYMCNERRKGMRNVQGTQMEGKVISL